MTMNHTHAALVMYLEEYRSATELLNALFFDTAGVHVSQQGPTRSQVQLHMGGVYDMYIDAPTVTHTSDNGRVLVLNSELIVDSRLKQNARLVRLVRCLMDVTDSLGASISARKLDYMFNHHQWTEVPENAFTVEYLLGELRNPLLNRKLYPDIYSTLHAEDFDMETIEVAIAHTQAWLQFIDETDARTADNEWQQDQRYASDILREIAEQSAMADGRTLHNKATTVQLLKIRLHDLKLRKQELDDESSSEQV